MIIGMEPKIRSFGPPVAKLWPNILQYISAKLTLDYHKVQKQKLFCERFALDLGFPPVILVDKPLKALCLS